MLMTETLYSLRKRAMRPTRGSMRAWLRFHIFTGIVGSYLVILHSAWSFNGLAGVLTLMTAVVVISGFIGRYIYTAMPRTADGIMVEAQVLQLQLDAARQQVRQPRRPDGALPFAARASACGRGDHGRRDAQPGARRGAAHARARAADGGAPLGAASAGDLARDPHPARAWRCS